MNCSGRHRKNHHHRRRTLGEFRTCLTTESTLSIHKLDFWVCYHPFNAGVSELQCCVSVCFAVWFLNRVNRRNPKSDIRRRRPERKPARPTFFGVAHDISTYANNFKIDQKPKERFEF